MPATPHAATRRPARSGADPELYFLGVRFHPETVTALRDRAAAEERSLAFIVRRAVRTYLAAPPGPGDTSAAGPEAG